MHYAVRAGIVLPASVHVSVCLCNKKIRYREEHSASVVLSWCTL